MLSRTKLFCEAEEGERHSLMNFTGTVFQSVLWLRMQVFVKHVTVLTLATFGNLAPRLILKGTCRPLYE